MRKHAGFTMVELLVVIAIAATLAAIAFPNISTFVKNDRLVSDANTLVGSLNYARNEAIKLGGSTSGCGGGANSSGCVTTICASTDGTDCSGSTNWATGWIVCDEPAASTNCTGTGATLMRSYPALVGGVTLSSQANAAGSGLGSGYFSFTSNSMLQYISGNPPSTTFVFCDSRGPSYGREVDLQISGRAEAAQTVGYQIDGATAIPSGSNANGC